jgi:hypothetical protein
MYAGSPLGGSDGRSEGVVTQYVWTSACGKLPSFTAAT